jgi:hypothetical protein
MKIRRFSIYDILLASCQFQVGTPMGSPEPDFEVSGGCAMGFKLLAPWRSWQVCLENIRIYISNYKHRSRILNSEDIDDENDDIHKDIHKDVRQFPDIHKNYLDEL